MKNFNKKNNRGFTIIETLVAVFILSVAITGPLVFAQSGLRAAFLARDQITALFLAQDAMESIKNIRDSNGLAGAPWTAGISNCIGTKCTIDTTLSSPTLSACVSSECPNLKIDTTQRYGYTSGQDSIFKRTIYIKNVTNTGGGNIADQIQVVVKVTWQSHERIGERSVVVQENLFNWVRN